MALCKLGISHYNGKPLPIYLLSGNATSDGEDKPVNGKSHARVSVAAVRHADDSTTYINVNGWRDRAADIIAVRTGESLLVIGPLKEREYNGKKYFDMDAEYISRSGVDGCIISGEYPTDYGPDAYATRMDYGMVDLTDEDDSSDLPF